MADKLYGLDKRTDIPRYSQNYVVGTIAVGKQHAVGVTQGRLVIVGGAADYPIPFIDYDAGFTKEDINKNIKTRKIRLPGDENDITVDVLLIKYSGDISVEAILKEVSGKYSEVEVHLEGGVKIYD